MTTYATDDLRRILELHGKWLLGEDGGTRAVLTGADLRGAVLRGADLRDAVLRGAVLRGAVLRGAVLRGADLRDADLTGAVLRGADLRGADLRGAVLTDDVILSDGTTWGEYKRDLVPALCVAGGKTLEEVATEEHWNCHSWNGTGIGCPMAVAFDAHDLQEIPVLYRAQAERFIQFFDAFLIPRPGGKVSA